MPTALVLAAMLGTTAMADDAIIGGSTTSDFLAVGQLLVTHDRYGAVPFCSATLVRDNWVVSAAHCVTGAEEYTRYGFEVVFAVGTSIYASTGIEDYAKVTRMVGHPGYRGTDHDVAVMELEGAGLPDVPKISLNEDRATSGWVRTDMTYVGWGNSNDSGSGAGTKRTVDVPIYYVDSGVIYTWATRGGANICSGDSGGAALRPDDTTGELELVGVNSFGFMADGSREVLCDDPDAIAGVSRVDVDIDWFIDYIGEEPEPEPEPEEDDDTGGETDSADPEELEEDDDGGGKKTSGCSAVGGVAGGLGLTLALVGAVARRRDD
jgi:hypothetical protein